VAHQNPNRLRRRIFDMGPQPIAAKPNPPVLADGQNPRGVQYTVEYEEFEAAYRSWFAANRQFEKERQAWERKFGQAAEIDLWSVDAGEYLMNDPKRYRETLPAGVQIGPYHDANRRVI
jgi:hypothetical protein